MQTLPGKAASPSKAALVDEFGGYALQLMWVLRQDAAQAFGPLGFRTVRALLLEFVGRGHTQPKELAELLGVVPPAVSTIIAELTERGFLARQGHPEDGRRVQLSLTDTGQRARTQLRDAWNKTGVKRLGSFSDEELETFVGLCRKLLSKGPEPLT